VHITLVLGCVAWEDARKCLPLTDDGIKTRLLLGGGQVWDKV